MLQTMGLQSLTWLRDWKAWKEKHTHGSRRGNCLVSPTHTHTHIWPSGASWDPGPSLLDPKISFTLWGTLWVLLYPLRSPSALQEPLLPPGSPQLSWPGPLPSVIPLHSLVTSSLKAPTQTLWRPSHLSGSLFPPWPGLSSMDPSAHGTSLLPPRYPFSL